MTCPVCGGALVPGQNLAPLFRFTRYDIPRPHPVLSKPITLRGIIATTGESRTDLTLHEQLQQRAAMGGPPERHALAAFRTIFTEALASALVAEIRKRSLDGSASAALANGLQTGQSAEPSTLQGSAHDNSAGVCRLRRMDARGPWTGQLTKSALQMTPTIDEILEVLNRHRVRATYGAVGDFMRVPAQSVSRWLGKRRPEASWVVAKQTLRTTGYTDDELHPDLPGSRVVTTAPNCENSSRRVLCGKSRNCSGRRPRPRWR
jgi:hypothetical protein